MATFRSLVKKGIPIVITLGTTCFFQGPCRAQVVPLTQNAHETGKYESGIALPSSAAAQSDASEATIADPPKPSSSGDDSDWHFDVSPYLWFPGVHGTIGALGRDVSVHATPGDLLSHFRFGLMGFVEARRKWLVLPLDLTWVRLGDSKALPFPILGVTNADLKGGEFILTPKVGVRVLNQERIKIDALTGLRYWHFYESLHFVPSNLNLNFSKSQDWVDPLVGGKITGVPTPKVVLAIFGDVGGWGTGSQLEYQFGGVLGYKIKPKWTLQAGYRHLFVDYRNAGAKVVTVTSGAL